VTLSSGERNLACSRKAGVPWRAAWAARTKSPLATRTGGLRRLARGAGPGRGGDGGRSAPAAGAGSSVRRTAPCGRGRGAR
ncbi:MAG: hypothetical protein ACK56I_06585, partial [bacterium]